MVSNSAGASGGLPCNSTNPAGSSSDPSRVGISDETESAPTDHFRQSYSSQGFSSEASSLLHHPGEVRSTPTIAPPLLNGLTGGTNRVKIHFQDL